MNRDRTLESRATTMVLLALIAVFGTHVGSRFGEDLRTDLTADRRYSLSEGSQAVLARMQREGVKGLEIKLYFSKTAGRSRPELIEKYLATANQVRVLLEEYELASKGRIRVRQLDPLPGSAEARDAQAFGLRGKRLNEHGARFFFGLVFETQGGSRDVIEFLWPASHKTAEYQISRRILSLLRPPSQRIGVMSSLEVIHDDSNSYLAQVLRAQGKDPGDSWAVMKLLEAAYEVSKIDADTDHIPPDEYDLVIVIHPKDFSERAIWALDEWVARGGNTLIFLDPFALDDPPPQSPQQPWATFQYKPSSNLEPLLAQWGLERREDRVVADFNLGTQRIVKRSGPPERVIVDLQIDDRVKNEALTQHPIFQGVSNLRFFIAGSLEEIGSADGVTLTPLIRSTADGNTLDIQPGFPDADSLVFLDLNEPEKLTDAFLPGTEPVAFAYLVQGRLPLAYPDGTDVPATPAASPPPGLPSGIEPPPGQSTELVRKDAVPEEERAEATVMVFADVDFISDQVAFMDMPAGAVAINDNPRLLLNAVHYLLDFIELREVRSKPAGRPFTLFDEIEAQADLQTREREQALRAEVASLERQLRDKGANFETGDADAVASEGQVQDQIEALNRSIRDTNRELLEIHQARRAAIEAEEWRVRFAIATMPVLVLVCAPFFWWWLRRSS